MTVTVGRAPLGLFAVWSATPGSEAPAWVCIAAIAIFAAADIFDGVWARAAGVDSPQRRALDSVIDRLTICGVFLALSAGGSTEVLAWLLIGTNALLALIALPDLNRGVVLKAPSWHRTWSSTLGFAAVALFAGFPAGEALLIAGVTLQALCGVDLTARRMRLASVTTARPPLARGARQMRVVEV